MISYSEWSAKGQYNSDKAKAAWDFAENQIISRILDLFENSTMGMIRVQDIMKIILNKGNTDENKNT